MSVFLIVGLKCTLAASHAARWWVTVSMQTGQTDRRTDGRTSDHYITLSATRGQRNKSSPEVASTTSAQRNQQPTKHTSRRNARP